jgi:uncharacterized 2Fe-2S/4Fe-4S cluster protein (DUF4445 family)
MSPQERSDKPNGEAFDNGQCQATGMGDDPAGRAVCARHTVVFQPSGRRGEIGHGATLLEAARSLGVDLESVCGGRGTCGKCRIEIREGSSTSRISSSRLHAGAPTETETRMLSPDSVASGVRLACQAMVEGELLVYVPEESRRTGQVVRKEASDITVPLEPAVRGYRVRVPAPELAHPVADASRLLAALEQQERLSSLRCDLDVVRKLPGTLGAGDSVVWAVVWEGQLVIDVAPLPASLPGSIPASPSASGAIGCTDDDATLPLLGLAVDIGTTTVAAYLVDLVTGGLLATESAMNPQVSWGEDVISRLASVMHDFSTLAQMQQTITSEIDMLAGRAAQSVGRSKTDIYDLVVVGNTVMHHLFLGLDPRHLGLAPFPPAVQTSLDLRAKEVGLDFAPGCRLHTLPVEAGFVGADNVAALIAQEPYKREEFTLLIDIGTNGELVLGNREHMVSASCATGPALEGAHIEFGMRAAEGAIERVRIDPQSLDVAFKVIGAQGWSTDPAEADPAGDRVKARGICGSGIIEAIAEMYQAGIILQSGTFAEGRDHPRILRENGKSRRFVLALRDETATGRALTISLRDVRSVQLAKGALCGGAETLLRRLGVEKPDRVVLAGAFGNYIDKTHALAIGLFPPVDPEAVASVGNAAGDGARLALLSLEKRREAAVIARQVEYVELGSDPGFQHDYVAAMPFPG